MQRIVIIILLIFYYVTYPTDTLGSDFGQEVSLLPSIVGENRLTKVLGDETLMEVSRRENLGYQIVANSNQDIDPWKPGDGTTILLPGEVIIPFGAQPGIVINLAELRLFYIYRSRSANVVDVYALGIGREGRETPEGLYHIITKKEHPDWRVPAGLREVDPTLPLIVPPGPQNPLGDYWLGLSAPGYGVHGTNRPLGVGRRVSYGCIRMYAQDIASLYDRVETGTPVIISYQPIKATRSDDYLMLEVHPDYLGRFHDPFQQALSVISKTGWSGEIDYAQVREVVTAQKGIPEIVGATHSEPLYQ